MYLQTIGFDSSGDEPLERLKSSFRTQFFYGLFRTKQLRVMVNVFQNSSKLSLVEFGLNVLCPAFGKFAVLPIFWMARDVGRYTTYTDTTKKSKDEQNPLQHVYDWPTYLASDEGLEILRDMYALYPPSIGSFDDFYQHVLLAVAKRPQLLKSRRKKNVKYYLKSQLKRLLPRFLLVLLTRRSALNLQRDVLEPRGFPWSDRLADEEYRNIKKFIFANNKSQKKLHS